MFVIIAALMNCRHPGPLSLIYDFDGIIYTSLFTIKMVVQLI